MRTYSVGSVGRWQLHFEQPVHHMSIRLQSHVALKMNKLHKHVDQISVSQAGLNHADRYKGCGIGFPCIGIFTGVTGRALRTAVPRGMVGTKHKRWHLGGDRPCCSMHLRRQYIDMACTARILLFDFESGRKASKT